MEVVGEEPLAHPDLRCGEADAVFEVHRVVHAVDQGDEIAGELLDLARALLQHGIAEESQRVHASKLPARSPIRRGGDRRRSGAARGRGRRRRPAAASASQRSATVDGARSSARRPVGATGPRTVTPPLRPPRPHAAATASGVAAQLGEAAERREPERPGGGPARRRRRASDAPWRTARTTSWSGSRVWSSSRPCVAEQPGAPHEQPERLLGGPRPRREELLVELEVRDQTRPAPATRWSTASVPIEHGRVGTGASVTIGGGVDRADLGARAAARRGRRARARSPGARRGTCCRGSAGTRAGGPSRSCAHTSPCSRCSTVAPQRLAARELPARSGTRATGRGPRRFSTQTARCCDRRCDAARRRAPRSATRGRVPRRAGRRPRRGGQRPAHPTPARPPRPSASTVGAGVTMRTAAPARRGALDGDVARVPRGRALVLERLVALVEHDDRGQVGHRRPHRGATADHDARAGPRAVPLAACAPRRRCSEPSVTTSRPSSRSVASQTRRARAADGSSTSVDPSGASSGRRARRGDRPMQQLAPVERRAGVDRDLAIDRAARADDDWAATRPAGTWRAVRPNATPPTGTGRPPRPAGRPTPAPITSWRSLRGELGGTAASSSRIQPRTRRPWRGTRTIVPTVAPAQRRREGIEERAVDRRNVGLDPDDRTPARSGDRLRGLLELLGVVGALPREVAVAAAEVPVRRGVAGRSAGAGRAAR